MFFFASQQEEGHSISLAVEFPAFTAAESEGSADVADWEQHIDMYTYIYIYIHVQMYLHTTVLMFEGTHINVYVYIYICGFK